MKKDNTENNEKKYIAKITLKNLLYLAPLILSIIGGAFGLGVKVELEVSKVAMAKTEQACMEQIKTKDLELYEWKRKTKEFEEDKIFFKRQYAIYYNRLKQCLKNTEYIEKEK